MAFSLPFFGDSYINIGVEMTKDKYPERASEVPVTQRMLFEVRDELKEHAQSLFEKSNESHHDLKSEFHQSTNGLKAEMHEMRGELKAEMHEMRGELKAEMHEMRGELKAEIHEVKADIAEIRSDIHGLKSDVHQIKLLVEEQNARNKIVLDGLTSLFARQERIEKEFQSR